MKQLCAINAFAFLCVHTLGQHGAAPPHQSLAGPPPKIQSLQSRAGVVASILFFSTKDSKGRNEESANFFPFPLKMQTDSMDLDGTGRASEGLWGGNRVGRKVQFLIIM